MSAEKNFRRQVEQLAPYGEVEYRDALRGILGSDAAGGTSDETGKVHRFLHDQYQALKNALART